jgi:hypothetical protein
MRPEMTLSARKHRCRCGGRELFKRPHASSAPVAQLDRALPSEGRGQGFESLRARQLAPNGIRFVTIGSKTLQSVRRVPFPADLLPHLPKKITGQLIPGGMDTAGKRSKKWHIEIGVIKLDDDERNLTPMHSFRHRAAKRMRAAGIPEDVREAVGGWANGKKKTSRKYGNKHGKGYPIKVLRKAIDTIGM